MSYLSLTKKIMQNELSNEELIACLNVPNIPAIQQTILKLIERNIRNENVRSKLLEYSKCMDYKFKIAGLYRTGHLAILALKKLKYIEEYRRLYKMLSDEDKKLMVDLERTF